MTDARPCSEGAASAHREMRIVLECAGRPVPGGPARTATIALDSALPGWHAEPLVGERDGVWLVSGQAAEQVGTAEYAHAAHTLVQRILDDPDVARAEADLPVRPRGDLTPDDGRFVTPGIGDCAPGSNDRGWSLRAVRAADAWALAPAPGGAARGAGVVIGHPDTGYTLHPNLAGALDLDRDRDLLDGDDDARDPLLAADVVPWPSSFPGHGTKTASVIVGRETPGSGIVGVAPAAVLVPIRSIVSVVQLFDSEVARAVEYARTIGCDVITLSLGGKGFFGLERAIQTAVDAGIIVLAAAGNQVGIVVAPASYPNCLGVAATGVDDEPWSQSSRGTMVDVSAPGLCVWVAGFRFETAGPVFDVVPETGTSYAVAHVAGVAALWLAHHGPGALRERYGPLVQTAFLHLLRRTSRVPVGWDATRWGAGIVDATAMLAAPLPDPDELTGAGETGAGEGSAADRLAAIVGLPAAALERALEHRLELGGDKLTRTLARFEGELAFHLLEQPAFRAYLLDTGAADAPSPPVEPPATCSPGFAAAFLPGTEPDRPNRGGPAAPVDRAPTAPGRKESGAPSPAVTTPPAGENP
jgi:subtilisin family serine protease